MAFIMRKHKMSSAKEKEILLNIIERYKGMPFLWDKNHKDYKSRDARSNGNKLLLDLYKQFDNNVSMKTLIKKIQNLRTGYLKELKKVKETYHSGMDEVYLPTLWYFEAMSFISPYDEHCCRVREPMDTEDLSTSSTEAECVQRIESAPTSPQKKKVRKPSSLQTEDPLENTARNNLKIKDEEWEIIGKSIGLQLKDLNKKQFFIAQKIIHDTIYYAQMNLLTECSSVTGLADDKSRHIDPWELPIESIETTQRDQSQFQPPSIRRRNSQSQMSGSSSSPKYYIISDT